ncbi:hypothetical protein [Helicovermis profundi]|uniref:Uncharacterized protein n=1 Tax=Helicovermis profundi TaxID=3065157 RepID=A0AAU9E657_9FIRM|nr:hypothetical protein HLPR_11890 [Clostridia bacterium S502]
MGNVVIIALALSLLCILIFFEAKKILNINKAKIKFGNLIYIEKNKNIINLFAMVLLTFLFYRDAEMDHWLVIVIFLPALGINIYRYFVSANIIYDKGIVSDKKCMLWDEVKDYKIDKITKNKGKKLYLFFDKKALSGAYVDNVEVKLKEEYVEEIRNILVANNVSEYIEDSDKRIY